MNSPSPAPKARRFRLAGAFGTLCLLVGLAPATAQETIEDARELQRQIEDEQLRVEAEIDEVNSSYAEVTAAYDAAQQLVNAQSDRVAAGQIQLDSARLRLVELELSIDWTEYDLEQLGDRLAEYAIEAYLGKQDDASANLLIAADVNEGVTRVALLESATNTSEDVVDQARGKEVELAELRSQADATVLEIESIQAALEDEYESLATDRDRAEKLRLAVDSIRADLVDQRDDFEAEFASLDRFIANKQAAAAANSANVDEVSVQGYVWPTAGGVGSVFGQRLHPILGYYRMHSGLDIGGEYGQPIYAAKAGTVILAGVNGGYGNTIVIDHGEGLSSLYAHQTSFEVKNGDTVTTGQHIGNVGSTGLSTGPHLHFEIRLFGAPIDPLPFMPAR